MWACLRISFSSYSAVKIVKSNPDTLSEGTLALRTALARTEEVVVLTKREKTTSNCGKTGGGGSENTSKDELKNKKADNMKMISYIYS